MIKQKRVGKEETQEGPVGEKHEEQKGDEMERSRNTSGKIGKTIKSIGGGNSSAAGRER